MEFVYVAPREGLFPACFPQGFHPFGGEDEAGAFLERIAQTGFFVERSRAETTPAWKQVIPYCVVVHEGRILRMRRRSRGGEARLHDKLSIGVGGHINPEDHPRETSGARGADGIVSAAARREISEELEVRGGYELRLVGYLNDDSNPVGAVHLGLIHVVQTEFPVSIRETDVLEGDLATTDELLAGQLRGDDFETWSSTLLAHMDRLVSVHPIATL